MVWINWGKVNNKNWKVIDMIVKSVEGLQDYKLLIAYSNNETKVFDMTKYWLWNIGEFINLHDIYLFNKVKPIFDTVQWENGLEIAPEELYRDSVDYTKVKSVTVH